MKPEVDSIIEEPDSSASLCRPTDSRTASKTCVQGAERSRTAWDNVAFQIRWTFIVCFEFDVPSIAQLVERRTVEAEAGILRSLVQIRLEGEYFSSIAPRG